MALVAVSNRDTTKYVSNFDPAKSHEWVKINPDDESDDAPKERKEVIDWKNATVFHLGSLDLGLQGEIYDDSMNLGAGGLSSGDPKVSVRMQINKVNIEVVRFGLRGWDNFQGPDGKIHEFKKEQVKRGRNTYDVVAPECMSLMDVELVQELAEKIKARSRVSVGLAKNSDAA